MASIYVDKHRNEKNGKYWDATLSKYPNLTIKEINDGDSTAWSNHTDAIISININSNWDATLAHEMLHLYLLSLTIDPYLILKSTAVLYPWIDEAFNSYHENTANLLNHTKMFPLFLEMGYPAESFIENYKDREVSKRNLKDLKGAYPFLKGDHEKQLLMSPYFS